MKKTGIAIIMLFLIVMSCKKESDMYSFFRQTHPQNLKTLVDGEFYSWAAADSAVILADYFLNIQGEITSYGDSIIAYGHCWSKDNANPSIGHDFDTTYNLSIFPNNSSTYLSYLSNLEADTEYNIRSFAIFGDAQGNPVDTGYNPVVSKISTLPAINEWFEQFGDARPNAGGRFDAVAFNFGDTIFFGSGSSGETQLNNDLYMFDPSTGIWEAMDTQLDKIEGPARGNGESVMQATGFALSWEGVVPGDIKKSIFIGLGDYFGEDIREDKSKKFIQYDLIEKRWVQQTDFYGFRRSNAVSFTIGDKAYVGTGKGHVLLFDWWVFDPAAEWDGDNNTIGWQPIDPPGGTEVGRTGAVAFSMNGRGYFGLGRTNDGFLNDFWEFRPTGDGTKGTWKRLADFPGEPRQNAAAFSVGTQGFIGTGDNIIGDMEGGVGAYSGEIFSDVYRYDPFNNRWTAAGDVRDYTLDKLINIDNPKKVTRASGFSGRTIEYGFIGFGMIPEADPRAQDDYWKYQPWQGGVTQ
ncbi:MAG: kelch repeat-containing protein [Bacteroidota bacterium]